MDGHHCSLLDGRLCNVGRLLGADRLVREIRLLRGLRLCRHSGPLQESRPLWVSWLCKLLRVSCLLKTDTHSLRLPAQLWHHNMLEVVGSRTRASDHSRVCSRPNQAVFLSIPPSTRSVLCN